MIHPGLVAVVVAVSLLGAACSSGNEVPEVEATGPPTIRPDVVARHAEQFDNDVPVRPAGSQEELAAATYLSGHLQLAGYVVFLDGVPVRDLVRSTNVIARAPSGEAPKVVVVVPYDTSEEAPTDGLALGLFLELARAMRVAEGGHDVSFTALGADHVKIGGRADLGSRRLAQELLDDDADPLIISLEAIVENQCLTVGGGHPEIAAQSEGNGGCVMSGSPAFGATVFEDAGFEHVTVSGDPLLVGAALLDFLSAGSD